MQPPRRLKEGVSLPSVMLMRSAGCCAGGLSLHDENRCPMASVLISAPLTVDDSVRIDGIENQSIANLDCHAIMQALPGVALTIGAPSS